MKIFKSRYFAVVSWLVCLVMLTASCSDYSDKEVVGLNERAYEVHYKSLDSTKTYAEKALSLSVPKSKAWAYAMNDWLFITLQRCNTEKPREYSTRRLSLPTMRLS